MSTQFIPVKLGWQRNLWKWRLSLKVNYLFWLVTHCKILTWDILQQKRKVGPSRCCLCGIMVENIKHLFIECIFTRSVWEKSALLLKCNLKWDKLTLMDCMDAWVLNKQLPKRLPILTCWFIWKERNMTLFDDLHPNDWAVTFKILKTLNIILQSALIKD
jgi:hypothetical protein